MSANRLNVIVSLVLAVVFVVFLSQGQSGVQAKTQAIQHYCGGALSNALSLVCNGRYNELTKRTGREPEMDDYPYVYDYPLSSRASANAMMGRFGVATFRRASRGVSDECCQKGCTIEEMRSYCLP